MATSAEVDGLFADLVSRHAAGLEHTQRALADLADEDRKRIAAHGSGFVAREAQLSAFIADGALLVKMRQQQMTDLAILVRIGLTTMIEHHVQETQPNEGD